MRRTKIVHRDLRRTKTMRCANSALNNATKSRPNDEKAVRSADDFFAVLAGDMTDQYVVIGNPIAHSRSPEIHAAFARQVGQQISYQRLLVPKDGFRDAVDALRRSGARGANVTVPFKFEAYHYATELTPRAIESGAVNTLRFAGDQVLGDNTDGIGLVRDLRSNLGVSLVGARVLLLGAGGAAYGVLGALCAVAPKLIAIANRTHTKAQELASKYSPDKVRAMAIADLAGEQFEVIINATAASLGGDAVSLPASCFAPNALAYDMMYGKAPTAFLQLAAHAGARTADGVGMLAEQAAEAFYLWRGVRPDTAEVIAMLKAG